MFRGTSYHKIDAKGRIIIPSRFREVITSDGPNGVMISGLDGGLYAYTFSEWGNVESKILSQTERSETMRRFRRLFVGGAFECTIDKQERVLIPPSLRQYAQLDKDIVLVGVLDHFEIWSQANFQSEHENFFENDLKNEAVRNEIATVGL